MSKQYFNVIMPVGADILASTKQQFIQQVAQAHNLDVHFPRYSLSEPAFDIKAAIGDLKGALFVIADLSLERPSCYYELGIAETIGKKVYLIAGIETSIHQTSNRGDIRFYKDISHLKILIEEIIQCAL